MPQQQPSPAAQVSGQLRQAIEHDADQEAIRAYRRQLAVMRAEKMLAKTLASAPPLSATQVAYLRGVLDGYSEDVQSTEPEPS
jgi:hypothetical protein